MMTRISNDPQIQNNYEQMLRAGQSPNIAEMLATRTPPIDKGDRTFLAGLDPIPTHEAARLKRLADRQGVNVNGRVYLRALANRQAVKRYGHDPKAWIGSRADVEAVARERKLYVEGAVNVDYLGVDAPPPEKIPDALDMKLIEKETSQHERTSGHKMRGRERLDYKEKLFNRRKGKMKLTFQGE